MKQSRLAVDPQPTRECHAIGCSRTAPLSLLFCAHHWSMLARSLQSVIARVSVDGARKTERGYLDVVAQAMRDIARIERRDVR